METEYSWWFSYPVNFDDLKLLCDVGRIRRQPWTSGHEAQEQNSLLIGEFFQALPQPANELVAVGDVTVTHHLFEHLHGHLGQTAHQLLQLSRREQGKQWDGNDGRHALPHRRHLRERTHMSVRFS